MTSRERLQKTMRGEPVDYVPVAPDFSNLIPAKLTGKPFWDVYLYHDPPIWEAYIECARYFDIDSVMDGYFPLRFPNETNGSNGWERFIVKRTPERIYTQFSRVENGKREWRNSLDIFPIDQTPATVSPGSVGMPAVPERFEPLEGVKPLDLGPEGVKKVKRLMGDQGLVGVWLAHTTVLNNERDIYDYYDNPGKYERIAEERIHAVDRRFANIMSLEEKPDFLCVGGSGTLIFQTPEIFRTIAFPAVKHAIELATAAGIPTQVHSCGPEKELVKMLAEETSLTVIDPLEVRPKGDCVLKDIKRLYGNKLTLKGNLHTTDVMLRGSVADVIRESKKCIDDAAEGGRFILSTGDQCGRDTPHENIRAMIDVARTYGTY